MKTIEVSAAIIVKDNKIFITKRGYGEFKGGWEFPGGKLEPNELPEECIVREIKEELDADIEVKRHLITVEYTYPNFHLVMHCFICKLRNDHVVLKEHEDACFVDFKDIEHYGFLPADVLVIDALKGIEINGI